MNDFDFKNPDYPKVFEDRANRLKWLRANPDQLTHIKHYYQSHIAQFITDWGMTFDPRNANTNLPSILPFILFQRQEEFVEEFLYCWANNLPLLVPKSREMGISWLCVAISISVGLFNEGVVAGFGSRKAEYVDKIGFPKSLFYKARMFIKFLPIEFRGGFDEKRHAPKMRINIPDTGSYLTGEAGDDIGRGDRTSFYFVDESAFLEHPQTIEASLSQTTNCRVDVSTVNGTDNPFYTKVNSGKMRVFPFHWREDPRKDQAWYDKQVDELDSVTIAQEIDMDFQASKEGIIIPSKWVQAAIGAHEKLGIEPTGTRQGAMDVADTGKDKNAFSGRHGFLLEYIESWSGKDATEDIFESVEKVFLICDMGGYESFYYESDGLGAGVRGDARVINERREKDGQEKIGVSLFRASGGVVDPKKEMVPGRKNKDYFMNHKAQGWWWLRILFQNTWRALQGKPYDIDKIISINPNIPELQKLSTELSQPTYSLSNGKILVNKQPDGTLSPNLADSVMINYAPVKLGRDVRAIVI